MRVQGSRKVQNYVGVVVQIRMRVQKKAIKVSAKMHEYCSDARYKMQNAKIIAKKKRIHGTRSVVLSFCLKLVN